MSEHRINLIVNGRSFSDIAEARWTLADFLRTKAGYTGTHIGCEHGVCGACTVIVDGRAIRSCLMLAVQAEGCEVRTIEGLAEADGTFHKVQEAMRDGYGLQCGFCTPGIVMTLASLTEQGIQDRDTLTAALSGHLCRCTGYQGIRRAIDILSGSDGREPSA